MKLAPTLISLLIITRTFGQHYSGPENVPAGFPLANTKPVNFDPAALWNYKLDTVYENRYEDSIKPVAYIRFRRIQPLWDNFKRNDRYNYMLNPSMGFIVFNLSDSAFCNRLSNSLRWWSRQMYPNRGGDLIFVGNFIFVSQSCNDCGKYFSNIDYCRGFVNRVLSHIDKDHISTLKDIVAQFRIKQEN